MSKVVNPGFARGKKFNTNNPNINGFNPFKIYVEKPNVDRLFKRTRIGNVLLIYIDGSIVELTRNGNIYHKSDDIADSVIYQLFSELNLIKNKFNIKLDLKNKTLLYHKDNKRRLAYAFRIAGSYMERKNLKTITVIEAVGNNLKSMQGPGTAMSVTDFKRKYR